jgi:hypothetical protein
MEQEWTNLASIGFPNYSLSTSGEVRNDETGKLLALTPNNRGHFKVSLYNKQRERNTIRVAPLVADFWLPGRTETFDTVIHLDGNKANASLENLAWRPRWFAWEYHRQFEFDHYWIERPIEDADTEEFFSNSLRAVVKYGLLAKGVLLSILNQEKVFPHWQRFRYYE